MIVTFPSKEAADINNELPETAAMAEKMAAITTEGPSFSNIEVVDLQRWATSLHRTRPTPRLRPGLRRWRTAAPTAPAMSRA